ncbi:hypothetical protein COT48_00415 [Candidatus Woesearchaeota archaeon CG08_land_8_20_14_0_20_47_9]|nr:MAG: hypothetical protein AUJ69_02020 [Candidatus Woesearchaeota archaeon CG1_02_47_18]PIO04439.1 MAG: hypothetical protein COT48_00415 [Candidatus Woesearchaeota archaeon CG08_land_8_20_14_0_20_47_9]HII29586.1 hypothetical protein [Candidatus Woesearchaeota archaeon]
MNQKRGANEPDSPFGPDAMPGRGLQNQLLDITKRIRMIEERNSNLQKRLQLIEQNMLTSNKRIDLELRSLSSDAGEIKKALQEIKERIKAIIRELQGCAKSSDVVVLERYINLWEPVNFVTHHELPRLVREIIDETKALKMENPKTSLIGNKKSKTKKEVV